MHMSKYLIPFLSIGCNMSALVKLPVSLRLEWNGAGLTGIYRSGCDLSYSLMENRLSVENVGDCGTLWYMDKDARIFSEFFTGYTLHVNYQIKDTILEKERSL